MPIFAPILLCLVIRFKQEADIDMDIVFLVAAVACFALAGLMVRLFGRL